jgi:threonine/homoserine/homoserine lactone efflux protein
MAGSYLASVALLALLALSTVVPGPDVAVVSRFVLTSGRRSAAQAATGLAADAR